MASPRQHPEGRPQPRLYLVTPATAESAALARDIAAILDAEDIAAVLLRLPDTDARSLINHVKTIASVVQKSGTALILDGHPDLVARGGADGAHLRGADTFAAAVDGLKPQRIAGAGGLATRHDAMLVAERGADYVMFGEPDERGARPAFDAVLERVAWWAEVFEAPCIGYAQTPDEIGTLARAGADFVAVGDFVFADARGPAAAIIDAAERLTPAEALS